MNDNLAVVLIITIVVIYQLIMYCADAYVIVKTAKEINNASSQEAKAAKEA